MTVPGNGYTAAPGSVVYMVPQGYALPPNYGVPVQAGQGYPQQVMAQAHYNQGMVGDGGQHHLPGGEPPSYQPLSAK